MLVEITKTSFDYNTEDCETPAFEGCEVRSFHNENSNKTQFFQTYEASPEELLLLGEKLDVEIVITSASKAASKEAGCKICLEIYDYYRE